MNRLNYPQIIFAILFSLSLWLSPNFAHATDATNVSNIDGAKRAKVIDFEDDVVEGVNRRPLDSLSQISEADRRRKKPHLYRKRVGFTLETAESFRALRFIP